MVFDVEYKMSYTSSKYDGLLDNNEVVRQTTCLNSPNGDILPLYKEPLGRFPPPAAGFKARGRAAGC